MHFPLCIAIFKFVPPSSTFSMHKCTKENSRASKDSTFHDYQNKIDTKFLHPANQAAVVAMVEQCSSETEALGSRVKICFVSYYTYYVDILSHFDYMVKGNNSSHPDFNPE